MPTLPALSYSSLRTYLECPLRWKYLYVDNLAEAPRGYFSFGRTVHSVLEELLRPLVVAEPRWVATGRSQRTLDQWSGARLAEPRPRLMPRSEMLQLYRRLWTSDGYVSGEEEERYRLLGEDLLSRFYEVLCRELPTPVAVEAHLETRWDGIPIHGYIDRIDRTPRGGLDVVDYKTSRGLSNLDARESDQLSLYQVLVERNYPSPVETLTIYDLRGTSPIRVEPRSRNELDSLWNRLAVVSEGIQSETFEPTPGRVCVRCEFRPICPEYRELPETDRARLAVLVDRFADLRRLDDREAELSAVADQLHVEAERLGIHRFRGSRYTAVRRREESWTFPPEITESILAVHPWVRRLTGQEGTAVRRLLADPTLDPSARKRIAESGARSVRWRWELEEEPTRG